MIYLKLFIILVLGVILFLIYHIVKFRNPYKLIMFVGKKGSGKTTMITKLALQYQRKGRLCFSTVAVPGVYLFDAKKIGTDAIPPESVIFIDEASLWCDLKQYFRYQRQYRHTVYLFSQAFDIDLKLRNLTDEMYIIHNVANCFSIARKVVKNITVISAKDDGVAESRIVDDLHYESILWALFGGMKITYLPRYAKFFNSFDPPKLSEKDDYVYCDPVSSNVRYTHFLSKVKECFYVTYNKIYLFSSRFFKHKI